MVSTEQNETLGAWVFHHGRKLIYDVTGTIEFPAINEGAKAATLLAKLGQTDEAVITKTQAKAIAQGAHIDPRLELNGLLQILERKRLIEQSENEISILGVTTRGSLGQAYDIFLKAEPTDYELASITLAEMASQAPIERSKASELIGDMHKLSNIQTDDFLNRAESIGFVDKEAIGSDQLLFNGNLFRRDSIVKTQKVLSSLSSAEQQSVAVVSEELSNKGCLEYEYVERILTLPLFEKLIAAGLYDLNGVTNTQGNYVYVTSPAAFHKFVDPMIDDCFNMAKSLVAALTYGINKRTSNKGRINDLSALVGKLISGREVGPTTSIGQDYRVLEINGVVKLRADIKFEDRFYLRLVKKEVGELALQVLTQGNAYEQSLVELPNAPMSGYIDPEENRTSIRKKQSSLSKQATRDMLEALRSGSTF